MGITNFPGGVSSMGNLVGGAMTIPTLGGRVSGVDARTFWVDPANGSTGNSGNSPGEALTLVSDAYALTVDKRGDVIYLLNDGNTSGTARETATLVWANDNTHLIGLCAPTMLSQRARISSTSGAASIVTPQLTVSGNGNIFQNISFFEGGSENSQASTCVSVTGVRNYFNNVAMMNMGSANSADEAGSNVLLITAGEENTFDGCYIGLDTVARSGANSNVKFASAAARNIFRDCMFPMFTDANTPLFIDANSAGAIDRFAWFKDCMFYNAIGSTSTTITQAFSIHASAGGLVLLNHCSVVGITKMETTASTLLYVDMPSVDAADPAGGEMLPVTA